MKSEDVDTFEKLVGQLKATYDEVALLSKKSPNDAVNTFKLNLINKLLRTSNDFLGSKYIPFDDFVEFDVDTVPQNSDAAFILSQYLQCFEKLRGDNVYKEYGTWYWKVGAGEKIETMMPKKLKE